MGNIEYGAFAKNKSLSSLFSVTRSAANSKSSEGVWMTCPRSFYLLANECKDSVAEARSMSHSYCKDLGIYVSKKSFDEFKSEVNANAKKGAEKSYAASVLAFGVALKMLDEGLKLPSIKIKRVPSKRLFAIQRMVTDRYVKEAIEELKSVGGEVEDSEAFRSGVASENENQIAVAVKFERFLSSVCGYYVPEGSWLPDGQQSEGEHELDEDSARAMIRELVGDDVFSGFGQVSAYIAFSNNMLSGSEAEILEAKKTRGWLPTTPQRLIALTQVVSLTEKLFRKSLSALS